MTIKSDIDPIASSYLRKLTAPVKKGTSDSQPTRYDLNPIHKALLKRRQDAEKIYETLPDLETIISVAVSSMLCTKDLVTSSLIYTSEINVDEEGLTLEMRDALLEVVRDFFTNEKKLPQKLYEWIYDAMAFSGATPVLILPEASINKMFNLATESFKGNSDISAALGGLRKNDGKFWGRIDSEFTPRLSLEGYKRPDLSVTSNDLYFDPLEDDEELNNILGLGKHIRLIEDTSVTLLPFIRKKILSTESYKDSALSKYGKSSDVEKSPYEETVAEMGKNLNPDYDKIVSKTQYMKMPTAKEAGRSTTHPGELVLPSESVIPVTAGGEPVCYLVSIDNSGNPLSLRTVGTLTNPFISINGGNSEIINSTARALGLNEDELGLTIPKLMEQHAELTERYFIKSLENGNLGEGITLGKNEEFYRVITARHLAKRDTNILCVPAEQMAYFAVDIDSNGIGRSIIDRTKVISTVRMVHLFATMRGMIENSSRHILHTITLPEEERDGERAVALATHDIVRRNHSLAPSWGDVDDVYAQVHNAGISIKVIGNEFYPSSDIEQSDITPDFKLPDVEVDDRLIRKLCSAARIDPDIVLQPENIEFASQIWSKSLISAKQVIMKQAKLNKQITGYCRNYVYSSGILLDRLAETLKSLLPEDKSELLPRYLRLFVDGIDVTLPQPDTTFTKSQLEQFNDKLEVIKGVLEYTVTDAVADEVGVDSTKLKDVLLSWYSFSWLRNNGVEADLVDIFLSESEHSAIVRDITSRQGVVGALLTRVDKHLNKKLATVANKYGDADEEFDTSSDSDGGFDLDGELDDSSLDGDLSVDSDSELESDDAISLDVEEGEEEDDIMDDDAISLDIENELEEESEESADEEK